MLVCSVLQRMLRRNPLAALALNQPSMRSMSSLSIADDEPFSMDDTNQTNKELPDGKCCFPVASATALKALNPVCMTPATLLRCMFVYP